MKSKKKILPIVLVAIMSMVVFAMVTPSMADIKKDIEKVSGLDTYTTSDASATNALTTTSASDFKGTWINSNQSANGMIKFIITSGTFHGYGACSPTPCDWGTTPLTLYSTSITNLNDTAGTAQYNFSFKNTIITLRMINPYYIKASDYNKFTDGSGRHNYFEENMAFYYKRIPTPKQLSPPNGSVFSKYPRTTTLNWSSVAGAVSYKVEIQYCDPKGCNVSAVSYPLVSLRTTSYTFNFVGAQPGRWRVWAIDTNGKESLKSGWWYFKYTI